MLLLRCFFGVYRRTQVGRRHSSGLVVRFQTHHQRLPGMQRQALLHVWRSGAVGRGAAVFGVAFAKKKNTFKLCLLGDLAKGRFKFNKNPGLLKQKTQKTLTSRGCVLRCQFLLV